MSPTLTPVHFVGALRKAIGHARVDLDVKSPSEALRAMDVITRGKLSEYLRGEGKDRLYRIALGKPSNTIDAETEGTHRSGRTAIYFIPTIRGRNSGFGKVLAGIALIALAVISQQYYLLPYAWSAVGTTAWAAAGTIAMGFGVSLVLGGITQMLTPTPKGQDGQAEQRLSTTLAGNTSVVVQGGCVPVVYGRMLVAPLPVLISMANNDVSTTFAGVGGTVVGSGGSSGGGDSFQLPGGGQQYSSGPSSPIGGIPGMPFEEHP